MKVAIVGSGVSGLVCAHLLHPGHDITLFEADDRLGGHTNTVRVNLGTDNDPEFHNVDTGFIVYNERNYPNFARLLQRLGVATHPSEMSFAVTCERTGTEYRGTNLNTMFAQRSNVVRPSFWALMRDIVRFNKDARSLLATTPTSTQTLADFLDAGGYRSALRDLYLIPMGAAIWSADPTTFDQYPAATLFRFLDNHGLISLGDRPAWRTVSGGARRYVDALIAPFEDRIRLATPVDKIVRRDSEVEIHSASGTEVFDRVILATHSDQALRLLSDPTDAESEVLSAISYQPNSAVLHSDERLMPQRELAWASWNYRIRAEETNAPMLTYDMNRLQGISSSRRLLVTLNEDDAIDPNLVLARFQYAHPVFDEGAVAAQERHDEINGKHGTYFAGAYWGYGFHEDGVKSAIEVCKHFGASL